MGHVKLWAMPMIQAMYLSTFLALYQKQSKGRRRVSSGVQNVEIFAIVHDAED